MLSPHHRAKPHNGAGKQIIPQNIVVTTHDDQFLLDDTGVDDANRILMFAMEMMLSPHHRAKPHNGAGKPIIPQNIVVTTHNDQFLLDGTGVDEANRILMFTTDEALAFLRQCELISVYTIHLRSPSKQDFSNVRQTPYRSCKQHEWTRSHGYAVSFRTGCVQ